MDIDDGDDDFNTTKKKQKSLKSLKDVPEAEAARRDMHTLDEHHEHVLSASYDLSFSGSAHVVGMDLSSSQFGGPAFDNSFFSDGLDAGDDLGIGFGDDLARELGWGVSPVKSIRANDRQV